MAQNLRKIIPIVLLVSIAAAAIWFFLNRTADETALDLTATGTIEAVEISVSAELSGRVADVFVQEGDMIQTGEALVRFENELLEAQVNQARAGLTQAQANYELVASGLPPAQKEAFVEAARLELLQAEQALEELHDKADLAAAQAAMIVAEAEKELDRADEFYENIQGDASQIDIDAAHAAVVIARDELNDAQEDFEPYENKPEDNLIRAQLQARVAAAQKKYDNLVTRYNNLVGTVNDFDLALARAAKDLAHAHVADAQRSYEQVRNGPDPEALALAEARLSAAQANLASALAGPSDEQLELAAAQVELAQASLEFAEKQIEQSLVSAPVEGLVMNRLVEPGEVVMPGSVLLILGQVEDLMITVYIPEDRYGAIRLGDEAQVNVDSFPGEIFTARVISIADKAEFTPRNVQTAEGRRTTVFAVELAVDDPQGKLKPGMPADVTFGP